jgi:hypothetical protein
MIGWSKILRQLTQINCILRSTLSLMLDVSPLHSCHAIIAVRLSITATFKSKGYHAIRSVFGRTRRQCRASYSPNRVVYGSTPNINDKNTSSLEPTVLGTRTSASLVKLAELVAATVFGRSGPSLTNLGSRICLDQLLNLSLKVIVDCWQTSRSRCSNCNDGESKTKVKSHFDAVCFMNSITLKRNRKEKLVVQMT